MKHTPQVTQPELPYPKLCECGCGLPAPISDRNDTKRGYVKGQPLRFIIGHHNNVRPKMTLEERFWRKVDKRGPDECWEWTGYDNGYGYGVVLKKLEDGWHHVGAHRVSYELHYGPIPSGLGVLHKCDNPPCCNPAHLFLGTQLDNMQDCKRKQREKHPPLLGERNGNALFTNVQAREFREQFAKVDMSVNGFARLHNVPPEVMRGILKRKTYQDA